MKIVKHNPSVDVKKMKMRKAVELVKRKKIDIRWAKNGVSFNSNLGLTESERDLLVEVFKND